MSALTFRKIPLGSVEGGSACIEVGCNRRGRHVIEILGKPLRSATALTRGEKELLCPICRNRWLRLFRELNGEKFERDVIKALTTLQDSYANPKDRELRTGRVDAIDFLVTEGFTHEQLRRAKEQLRGGVEPDAVFGAMVWGEPVSSFVGKKLNTATAVAA